MDGRFFFYTVLYHTIVHHTHLHYAILCGSFTVRILPVQEIFSHSWKSCAGTCSCWFRLHWLLVAGVVGISRKIRTRDTMQPCSRSWSHSHNISATCPCNNFYTRSPSCMNHVPLLLLNSTGASVALLMHSPAVVAAVGCSAPSRHAQLDDLKSLSAVFLGSTARSRLDRYLGSGVGSL